ncbi:MAG: hypothetical protein DHS80DRAFT_33940 [Piptocephalis tieghemiana]|nr:MAG: hypothetical protein DHS80DRAFT_33940 [Piptocephalis tieghemiana]
MSRHTTFRNAKPAQIHDPDPSSSDTDDEDYDPTRESLSDVEEELDEGKTYGKRKREDQEEEEEEENKGKEHEERKRRVEAMWAMMNKGGSESKESASPSSPTFLEAKDGKRSSAVLSPSPSTTQPDQERGWEKSSSPSLEDGSAVLKDKEEGRKESTPPVATSQSTGTTMMTTTLRPGPRRPKSTLADRAAAVSGHRKGPSTLERSRLQWVMHAETTGMRDALKHHNKDGYIERQSFLERTQVRRHDQLKSHSKDG